MQVWPEPISVENLSGTPLTGGLLVLSWLEKPDWENTPAYSKHS
jgi:hypothetical protein